MLRPRPLERGCFDCCNECLSSRVHYTVNKILQGWFPKPAGQILPGCQLYFVTPRPNRFTRRLQLPHENRIES